MYPLLGMITQIFMHFVGNLSSARFSSCHYEYISPCVIVLLSCSIIITCRYINAMNRRNLTYKLAVNHMADYSVIDFRTLRGVIKNGDSPRNNIPQTSIKSLPPSWNWWLEGMFCGMCFTTMVIFFCHGFLLLYIGKNEKLFFTLLISRCMRFTDCNRARGNVVQVGKIVSK